MNTIWPEPASPQPREPNARATDAAPLETASAAPLSVSRADSGARTDTIRLMPAAISTALATCKTPSERLHAHKLSFIGPISGAHDSYPRECEKSAGGRGAAVSQMGTRLTSPRRASSTNHDGEPLARFYLSAPACSGPEGFILGLITAAAVLGIGYGVGCSLQLVQNWHLFSAGIATLIR